ncbi:unnamed protein product [Closterium sp. NIES-64]|nr:unnamed protein product [Closterium sp. NIES-64]
MLAGRLAVGADEKRRPVVGEDEKRRPAVGADEKSSSGEQMLAGRLAVGADASREARSSKLCKCRETSRPEQRKRRGEEARRGGGAEERRCGGEEERRRGGAEERRRGGEEARRREGAKDNSLPLNCRSWLWVQSLGAHKLFLPSYSAGDASLGMEQQTRRSRGDASEEEDQRRAELHWPPPLLALWNQYGQEQSDGTATATSRAPTSLPCAAAAGATKLLRWRWKGGAVLAATAAAVGLSANRNLQQRQKSRGDDWQLLGAEEKARCYLPRSYLPPMSCIRGGGAEEMHKGRRSRGDASEEKEQRRCIRGGGAEEMHQRRRRWSIGGAEERSLALCLPLPISQQPTSRSSRGDGEVEATEQQRRGRRGKGVDGEEEGDGALERHGVEGTEERSHGGKKTKGAEEQRTAQLRFPPTLLAARRREGTEGRRHGGDKVRRGEGTVRRRHSTEKAHRHGCEINTSKLRAVTASRVLLLVLREARSGTSGDSSGSSSGSRREGRPSRVLLQRSRGAAIGENGAASLPCAAAAVKWWSGAVKWWSGAVKWWSGAVKWWSGAAAAALEVAPAVTPAVGVGERHAVTQPVAAAVLAERGGQQ